MPVLLLAAAPALNPRMMRQGTKRICAMEIADTPKLKACPSGLSKRCRKMIQNSKRKLKELISVAFQLRMSKVLKLKQIPRSSSPRTRGFKSPTDIFPKAERPDNRMKKRLTNPRRGRAKEHGAIPANDPNVPNTNSWGKQMKGKTQNPEIKRAHRINHLMVASSRHK